MTTIYKKKSIAIVSRIELLRRKASVHACFVGFAIVIYTLLIFLLTFSIDTQKGASVSGLLTGVDKVFLSEFWSVLRLKPNDYVPSLNSLTKVVLSPLTLVFGSFWAYCDSVIYKLDKEIFELSLM